MSWLDKASFYDTKMKKKSAFSRNRKSAIQYSDLNACTWIYSNFGYKLSLQVNAPETHASKRIGNEPTAAINLQPTSSLLPAAAGGGFTFSTIAYFLGFGLEQLVSIPPQLQPPKIATNACAHKHHGHRHHRISINYSLMRAARFVLFPFVCF